MPATGQRGAQRPAPGNVTGMRFYEQQRELAAKKRAAENPIDVAEIRRQARIEVHQEAFEAGAAWAFETLANAGVDVDSVLALDADEPDDENQVAVA